MTFLRAMLTFLALLVISEISIAAPIVKQNSEVKSAKPRGINVVFILADDLGYGDLGCYGQTKIRTPNIDRLSAEAMRFTSHYAGNNVCAPSRCVLLTGMHPGHAMIRDNRQAKGFAEGQEPVPPRTLQLPLLLQDAGYVNGVFGKWGLGPVGSTGEPAKQGIDQFFGYNCQAVAHNYYPTHLCDNSRRIEIGKRKCAAHQKFDAQADPQDPKSYAKYSDKTFAPDLICDRALTFINANKEKPFVLFFTTTIPHLALQVPEDSLKKYEGKFAEEPYLGERGYLPHRTPRAAYAAMVTRLDRDVGRLVDLVEQLGLTRETIFVFTSDNGPLYGRLGGTDSDFFQSAGILRGRKGSNYEGGIRVPCIVRWKDKITPGTTSDRVTGFEDWLPTLLDLIGQQARIPRGIDGISFAQTLLGKNQEPRPFLYRESPGYGGQQSIRIDQWKLIRTNLNLRPGAKQSPKLELFDLSSDPGEKQNVASAHPEIVAKLQKRMHEQHIASPLFPIRDLDDPKKR